LFFSLLIVHTMRILEEMLTEMSQITLRRTISHIGPLQIAIIVLAVITALVHLDRSLTTGLLSGGHAGGPLPGSHAGGPPRGGGPRGGPSLLSALPIPLSVLFLLNFAAYIVLVVALYLPALRRFQRITRWLLILLAVVTIIAWFLITGGSANILAYIDKPVEIALIVLLIIEDRQAARLGRG
jgi:hypothetical protein